MIKKIMLGLLMVAPLVAFSQPMNQTQKPSKGTDIREPKYEVSKDKFNELKSVAIASIDRRVELLKREKVCIQTAQERSDLKKCLQEAQEYRKKMMEDFQERREQIQKQ